MAVKKGGLGKGLESLFDQNSNESQGAVKVNINDIEPNRNQPRRNFDDETLKELADSIEKHGLIQPIVVKPIIDGRYMIIAGERRWRACRMAGVATVPVIVKDTDDETVAELALIENLQREDLNPVEEALGYKSLIDKYALTQEEVASKMGKSRVAVTNALRLLSLEKDELEALASGKISAGHARALLSANIREIRKAMLEAALNGASVRTLEAMSKQTKSAEKTEKKVKSAVPTFYKEVEIALKNEIGRKVYIKPTSNGKGTLTVEFYNEEELADIARRLSE